MKARGYILAVGCIALTVSLAASALAKGPKNALRAASAFAGSLASPDDGVLAERRQLSADVFGGNLSAKQEASAVARLTALAKQTIFSGEVHEGDTVAFWTNLRAGETLAQAAKRCGAQVPWATIARINGMDESFSQEGRRVKMLRGPFHARIDKHQFALDVYLQGPDGEKVFVKRVKVALGRRDSTPVGNFRIAAKATHATWVPPKSMAKTHKKPVLWGQKGYPLGKDGIFMSLRGTDRNNKAVKGYGIHSTSQQSSIGQARSHGCIRVGDKDIGTLYTMFTEGASTVQIVP